MQQINTPYEIPVHSGYPFLDYKETIKTGPELIFVFKIENFIKFILKEICVTFPAVAVDGNTQLPLSVAVNVSSTQNQFIPRNIPTCLFSSPSQNFRLGVLDEEAQGVRLFPLIFDYPCGRGDVLTVSVTGSPVTILIGCMIHGRKYGAEYGGER